LTKNNTLDYNLITLGIIFFGTVTEIDECSLGGFSGEFRGNGLAYGEFRELSGLLRFEGLCPANKEKEKEMADKKILLKILVMALVSGFLVVGCKTLKEIDENVKDGNRANASGFSNTQKKADEISTKTDGLHTKTDDLNDKVDGLNDRLDELMKPRPLPQYPVNSRIVPISMEIIERTKAENVDIDKLDYYLSANITVHINDTNDKLEIRDGKLIETKTNQPEGIPITIADTGRMVSSGRNFFDISFTEENIVLRFERNTVRNRFDLVSGSKRGKNYSLNFENEKPYLVINYPYIPNNENLQIQGIGSSVLIRNDPPQSVDKNSTERIEGRGTLTPTAVVKFVWDKNRNYSKSFLEKFIGTYFKEAEKLGINPDVAIAQMCYITNFLRKQKVMNTFNYAGFSTMPPGGSFRNSEEGIQAHVQHLKGYASERYKPGHIVDPRWDAIRNFRGTADNLDELAKKWAPNNRQYAAEISGIINDMRRYAWNTGGV